MTLFLILGAVFSVVALMVYFGERYAKPMDEKEQSKYSKIIIILVFISLTIGLFKALF
ncbi:hypothetical protein [Thalassomonas sp. M1454]|uniref:hypothetical protein n=1 Tax=Thalassomonas sp. M1454 TaxID=2594477 RepID=UPI00163D7B19|nr:hypothetical protein [Thalassomonas sp. M1454]